MGKASYNKAKCWSWKGTLPKHTKQFETNWRHAYARIPEELFIVFKEICEAKQLSQSGMLKELILELVRKERPNFNLEKEMLNYLRRDRPTDEAAE